MEIAKPTRKTRRRTKAAWFILIVVLSTTAGMFAAWRLPGFQLYARDRLMRERGVLNEPEDIVIVAIDEPSIAKLGRFPWSRDYTAKVLENLAAARPKVIALDVLYSEPTNEASDKALGDAIKNAGNVVIGEQLIENRDTPEISRSEWLKSLPEIETSAAGKGHVNVETESDGAARELLLRLANDEGETRWALAVEAIRVGDGLNTDEITETQSFVRIGSRKLPFIPVERNLIIKTTDANSRLSSSQPLRMAIDYIGPTGSYSAQTYSFSDVLEGKISPEIFRGKYVLIGATAATLGDRIATPFVHTENPDGDQHGDLMPGVEILANEINTILRGRFYHPVSDWTAALFSALTAILVIVLLGFAEGKSETLKQIGVLAGLFTLILISSYLVFAHSFIIPPIVPVLTSFIVAVPLALLRRSLAASASLDERINELVIAGNQIFTNGFKRSSAEKSAESETDGNLSSSSFLFPHGLEWKSNMLGFLSRDLINRANFIDSALRSIEDGLLIADRDGQIIFANQSSLRIFNLSERRIIGRNLFAQIAEAENKNFDTIAETEEILAQMIFEQTSVEREITLGKSNPRYYFLRMAAVVGRETDEGETLGIIATLSDITQQRELQKTKNDVIALVTHELRTPLTAIQGMSEVLTEHKVEPEPQRKMLVTINTEAKRLAKMINEYLDITRLEAGAQKANFASVDVESLIERTLLMLEPLAAKREIKIARFFEANLPTISADSERLAQMLTNIVANAIKYSPPKTAVSIESRIVDGKLQINVADQGCGISAEQLPRIFDKFYRVPRRSEAEITGTGLGLALAQEIAELHGGYISVKSEIDKGSVFTIYLPLSTEFLEKNKNG